MDVQLNSQVSTLPLLLSLTLPLKERKEGKSYERKDFLSIFSSLFLFSSLSLSPTPFLVPSSQSLHSSLPPSPSLTLYLFPLFLFFLPLPRQCTCPLSYSLAFPFRFSSLTPHSFIPTSFSLAYKHAHSHTPLPFYPFSLLLSLPPTLPRSLVSSSSCDDETIGDAVRFHQDQPVTVKTSARCVCLDTLFPLATYASF